MTCKKVTTKPDEMAMELLFAINRVVKKYGVREIGCDVSGFTLSASVNSPVIITETREARAHEESK